MGINQASLDFILKTMSNSGIKLNSCRMMELGNQRLKGIGGVSKYYFQDLGVDHVYIDINEEDEALNIDLQKEIVDGSLINTFDVLTNFGTTEHVKEQYLCWQNIHNLVKQNGVFIHLLPRVGNWNSHGHHKYNLEFFQELSSSCGYEIVENFVRKGDPKKDFICCSMIKKENNEFITLEMFENIKVKV